MTRDQRNHIKERLAEVYSAKRSLIYRMRRKDPPDIQRAMKLVKRWNDATEKQVNQRQARLRKAYTAACESLLFDDATRAIRALREFERFTTQEAPHAE